jgi:subtilisin family serine protease/subtilisin-like proprotein convertase family protein
MLVVFRLSFQESPPGTAGEANNQAGGGQVGNCPCEEMGLASAIRAATFPLNMRANVLWLAALALLPNPAASGETGTCAFRLPQASRYRVEDPGASPGPCLWLKAWPLEAPQTPVEFGTRVVLALDAGADIRTVLQSSPATMARDLGANRLILEVADARAAVREAQRLAARPEVLAAYPVMRSRVRKFAAYAARPNDPHFGEQWTLENRAPDGTRLGLDLNVRGAWPVTRGEGTVIAIVDDGVEWTHPEFVRGAANDLHFNFQAGDTNALPQDPVDNHGTTVAGPALAEGNNGLGMVGVAPAAQLASWKVFLSDAFITEEQEMDMYQYRSNVVSVQNHAWGYASMTQQGLSLLKDTGISNAVTLGRDGRGVVMIRAGGDDRGQAGNGRGLLLNANDDGYISDPRVIAVTAVRRSGRAATYSSPGACLLLAAPGGDTNDNSVVFTTDRQGPTAGYNTNVYADDLADYVFLPEVNGTSLAAPQVAGMAALVLSANPALAVRDVQQILLLSARHFDLADPDVRTNGAGLRVSHNVGFGVPDAGQAVWLARGWSNRPPVTNVVISTSVRQAVPDDGLRVLVHGTNVPPALTSIPSTPSRGPHPDVATASLPLVDLGYATNDIAEDLTGKAALIQRGPPGTFADQRNYIYRKVERAAQAGAAFVVVYNNTNNPTRGIMSETDYVPIPAVLITQADGLALRDYLQQDPTTEARLELNAVRYAFEVTHTLSCEHVGLRVQTDHTWRGDLRITLVSPQGTRSVLQRQNFDASPGPRDWTYYSVHHFLEASAGTWTAEFSDEGPGDTGSVLGLDLILQGTPILDTDRDGLDDEWEIKHFGSLDAGPQEDPDHDGYNNAREQAMGTNPNVVDVAFTLDLSRLDANLARLSWPGVTNRTYEVFATEDLNTPPTSVASVPGCFPETEWLVPYTNTAPRFFRVTAPGR